MLNLYNTLTRRKEEFTPIDPPQVGLYTCGPTVYLYAHIGNFRTFLFEDFLRRVLEYNGFQVKHVMNITDVGHLTSDADTGEDKLEKGARREGKTVWEIADYYTQIFLQDLGRLNIKRANFLPKATEHIQEQIELIKKLEEKGFAYVTSTGVYFDTQVYENEGNNYSILRGHQLDEKIVGAREEVIQDSEKKSPEDFALWLFTVGHFKDHVMRWDSPWGEGFPGWHLECSAMSAKYLGQPFDIHTGGEDHIAIHHTNEIAQSQGVYDKLLANYWLHGKFMMVEGRRMGKSEGNVFLVEDLVKRGFDPLAFRYLCLTTHYRSQLNFTWKGLSAAQVALTRLRREISNLLPVQTSRSQISKYKQKFLDVINDDLNFPQALSVTWDLVKANLPSEQKLTTLLDFDQVLGLKLSEVAKQISKVEIPGGIKKLIEEREKLREQGNFGEADKLREQILRKGFRVEDTSQGPRISPK